MAGGPRGVCGGTIREAAQLLTVSLIPSVGDVLIPAYRPGNGVAAWEIRSGR